MHRKVTPLWRAWRRLLAMRWSTERTDGTGSAALCLLGMILLTAAAWRWSTIAGLVAAGVSCLIMDTRLRWRPRPADPRPGR